MAATLTGSSAPPCCSSPTRPTATLRSRWWTLPTWASRATDAHDLADLPLDEREALLNAPFLPFDGLNEHGLAIGMAAVPPGNVPPDPGKETIGSLGIIREMLDHARDVDEALAILQSYNVDMEGGPAIHYLLADRSGRALLVEFYQGEMVVTPNEAAWHQATNFLRAAAGDDPRRSVLALRQDSARPSARLGAGSPRTRPWTCWPAWPRPTPSGRSSTA